MMQLFAMLAEQKIQEAIERGELDDLPGAGKPLALDEDPLVPEDQRVAYRVLKNAGFVPLELEARQEIRSIEQMIDALPNGPERARALRRLQLLNLKLAEVGGARRGLRLPPEYYRKMLSKLG